MSVIETPLGDAQEVAIVCVECHLLGEVTSLSAFKYICSITEFKQLIFRQWNPFMVFPKVYKQLASDLPAGSHFYIELESPHWTQGGAGHILMCKSWLIVLSIPLSKFVCQC